MRNILKFYRRDCCGLLSAEDEDTIRVRRPGDLIFMQDDAPRHKAPDTMRFLEESDLQVMV